jgi:hypothetical protein
MYTEMFDLTRALAENAAMQQRAGNPKYIDALIKYFGLPAVNSVLFDI